MPNSQDQLLPSRFIEIGLFKKGLNLSKIWERVFSRDSKMQLRLLQQRWESLSLMLKQRLTKPSNSANTTAKTMIRSYLSK